MIEAPIDRDLATSRVVARRELLVAELTRATPTWRRPGVVALAAAAALVATFAVPMLRGGDSAQRLVYALEAGDELRYRFDHEFSSIQRAIGTLPEGITLGDDVRNSMRGELHLTIDEGPSADTLTVELSPTGRYRNHLGEEAPGDWPTITFVTTAQGEVQSRRADRSFPTVFLTDPTFGDHETVLPFSFGPTFPTEPVAPGDSWTTGTELGDRCGRPVCEPIVGEHEVTGSDELFGRDVLVIESSYSTSQFAESPNKDLQAYTNTTTVWFDPADGIIVKGIWEESEMFETEVGRYTGSEQVGRQTVEQTTSFAFELVGE
jgi:hypothetical protein